jgi:hypothetical protein
MSVSSKMISIFLFRNHLQSYDKNLVLPKIFFFASQTKAAQKEFPAETK